MEDQFNRKRKWENCWDDVDYEKREKRGRIWGGIILIGGGAVWLAHVMGVVMPSWLFTWPSILILAGLFVLGKNGFQKPGGLIMLVIGGFFLYQQANPEIHIRQFFWPAFIILLGIGMIFSPWRKKRRQRIEYWKKNMHMGVDDSTGDVLSVNAIFGGVEKNIISKNFKGGNVHCVFGGAEINLSQADIQGTVMLEVSAIFGGLELAVPSNWKVKSEVNAVLGGVSDKRPVNSENTSEEKVLILKGDAVFGGIEIKSYI